MTEDRPLEEGDVVWIRANSSSSEWMKCLGPFVIIDMAWKHNGRSHLGCPHVAMLDGSSPIKENWYPHVLEKDCRRDEFLTAARKVLREDKTHETT